MANRAPGGSHRSDEHAGKIGWVPSVLAAAFVLVVAVLFFAAPKPADRPQSAHRTELPNPAPHAPSIPAPSPPIPQ
jgi:hypothetical protein